MKSHKTAQKRIGKTRVKRGVTAHKRHKRLLKAAEGRKGTRSKLIKPAREALLHAMAYATRDRKQRKRQMRELWIVRINAAARQNGLTYGQFISGLKRADVAIDRKILADLAVRDSATFGRIAEVAKGA
jgi:large subunit ribosomal protein L20